MNPSRLFRDRSISNRPFRYLSVLVFVVCCLTKTVAAQVDFNREIRPILSSKCFTCHGPDEESREAGLRLDRESDAFLELDSGMKALVPGDIEASELYYRITTDDDSLRMPPPESGAALTESEQQQVKDWIESGASYDLHWAFKRPAKKSLPHASNPAWNRTPIDQYVFRQLEQAGLEPNQSANRNVLIRRVALTLTGLPPTLDEVTQFVEDDQPNAYERMVDRYLASSAYGEHWAAMWLDLARYADSQGYAQDPARTIWRYRDWVIDAFNNNQPFDQFTIEQLAGDLLEDPDERQLIATAFHRNTMTNSEGGTDDEEFRNAAVIDRVNTTMDVWTGLTFGCAQCHTHKYDPITQQEYFQLFAIFNQTADTDHPSDRPFLESFSESRLQQREQLRQQIASIRTELASKVDSEPESTAIEDRQGPLLVKRIRVRLQGERTFLHLAEVEAWKGEANLARQAAVSQISTGFGGEAARAIDGNRDGDFNKARSTTHTAEESNPWLDLTWENPQSLDELRIFNRMDNDSVRDRLNHVQVIAFDDQGTPVWAAIHQGVPNPELHLILPARYEERTPDQLTTLQGFVAEFNDPNSALKNQLAGLEKKLADLKPDIKTPIMQELPKDKQRTSFIHVRGDFRSRGEEVQAALPTLFGEVEVEQDSSLDRLKLACWLTHPDHPLTARVTVNRFWERVFGIGLVETSEDFGTQGSLPSHPELLDFLAVDFVEHGWDVKRLLKQLVMSETFRQGSKATEKKLAADPFNILLSRGPRFRLTAEQIRDQALAVAGQLSRKMYGPSVQPPRPNLGIRAAFGGSTDWNTSPGEDKYRRALYTSWRRTSPYPSMTTFDATSREICTIRRIRTNTPLQALVTMNDPVYVEAAQALARRVFQAGNNDRERWSKAVQIVLAREPDSSEFEIAERYLKSARERFRADPSAAEQMATDPIGPLPDSLDVADLAAWVVMCNVLLNLDESLSPR